MSFVRLFYSHFSLFLLFPFLCCCFEFQFQKFIWNALTRRNRVTTNGFRSRINKYHTTWFWAWLTSTKWQSFEWVKKKLHQQRPFSCRIASNHSNAMSSSLFGLLLPLSAFDFELPESHLEWNYLVGGIQNSCAFKLRRYLKGRRRNLIPGSFV